MIKSFKISNFIGLESLEISPFKRLNLIVGKNGTGKTALLKYLMHRVFGICADNPIDIVDIDRLRKE